MVRGDLYDVNNKGTLNQLQARYRDRQRLIVETFLCLPYLALSGPDPTIVLTRIFKNKNKNEKKEGRRRRRRKMKAEEYIE
jgi:hypothetical protein